MSRLLDFVLYAWQTKMLLLFLITIRIIFMQDHIPIRPARSLLLGGQTSKWYLWDVVFHENNSIKFAFFNYIQWGGTFLQMTKKTITLLYSLSFCITAGHKFKPEESLKSLCSYYVKGKIHTEFYEYIRFHKKWNNLRIHYWGGGWFL